MAEDKEAGQGNGGSPEPPTEGGDQEERPRITLDRYLGQRRRSPSWSYAHVLALVFMVAGLVLLFVYKERCGESVSRIIFMGAADGGASQIQPDHRGSVQPDAGVVR